MPRSQLECERIREETKDKIVSAAIKVFASKGYAATGTADIAKTANISVGLLYRHFSSKQKLFESITGFAVEGLVEMTKILSGGGNPKEIIDLICQDVLNEIENTEFVNLNMMMIQGMVSEDTSIYQTILQHDKKMFEAAAGLIARGQDEGVFGGGDPVAKSALLFSSIQGMTMMKFFFKDNFKTPTLADLTAFLF